jgi:ComF family protein
MINKSWLGAQAACLAHLKYFLFQEKCRVCRRFIHPELPGMDLSTLRPPATYMIQGREISCDCLCRLCWLHIYTNQPLNSSYAIVLSEDEHQYLHVKSAVNFAGDIKEIIYKFKYDGDSLLANDLAILSLTAWFELTNSSNRQSTYIIPVPLHRNRHRERGFNQSELLAKRLARLSNMKVLEKGLIREKKTNIQQALGKLERLSNVSNAFKADSRLVSGKRIVLIDDVLTSGATLIECARTLYKAEASEVLAFTIARVDS